MENNKIDRLFREKTESYNVKPSADAWGQISAQSQGDRTATTLWKIAAAVAIVVTGALVVAVQEDQRMEYAAADHPVLPANAEEFELYAFEVPEVPLEPNVNEMVASRSEEHQSKSDVIVQDQPQTAVAEPIRIEVPILSPASKRQLVASESQVLPATLGLQGIEEEVPVTEPVVSIKYYADSSNEEQNGKKKFGNLLAKAQTFSPGEFLADLRAAKDDLLRSKKMN